MINPNEPAMPLRGYEGRSFIKKDHIEDICSGLSIRAELSARAMQGLLSNGALKMRADSMAEWSVKCADSLIDELNKTQQP